MLRKALCFLVAAAILGTGAACDRVAAPAATANSDIEALRAFADAVERGQDTAFTAGYTGADGSPVTLAQEPPRRSYRSATSTYLLQPDGAYLCRTAIEPATCEQGPGEDGLTLGQARVLSSTFGGAVVPPELAQSLIRSAAAASGTYVRQTTKTIAGQPATCVEVSRTRGAVDYRGCVTSAGVLAWFDGAVAPGTTGRMRLTTLTTGVTDGAFALPAGVPVTAVDTIV